MHAKKTAFIVEHDFIMATYLADRVIVYEGEPSKRSTATVPQSLTSGKGDALIRYCQLFAIHRNLIFQMHIP
jgi:ATP-binding cassette subfamily E protein 1